MEDLLKLRGYSKGQPGIKADFSYWCAYTDPDDPKPVQSGVKQVYDLSVTHPLNDKNLLWNTLQSQNQRQHLIATAFTREEVEAMQDDSDRLWYLKSNMGAEGKGVWAYNTLDQLMHYFDKPGIQGNYIVQREPGDMQLVLGYKYSLRVYLVILAGQLHIHPTVLGKLHPKRYTRDSLERDVHIESANDEKKIPFIGDELVDWNKIWPGIVSACSDTLGEFFAPTPDRFIILGIDYIVDTNLKPWMVEVNTFPYLWDANDFVRSLKRTVQNDILDLVLDGRQQRFVSN